MANAWDEYKKKHGISDQPAQQAETENAWERYKRETGIENGTDIWKKKVQNRAEASKKNREAQTQERRNLYAQKREIDNFTGPQPIGGEDAMKANYYSNLNQYGAKYGDAAAQDEGYRNYRQAMANVDKAYTSEIEKNRRQDAAYDAFRHAAERVMPWKSDLSRAGRDLTVQDQRYARDTNLYNQMGQAANQTGSKALWDKAEAGYEQANADYMKSFNAYGDAYNDRKQAELAHLEENDHGTYVGMTTSAEEVEQRLKDLNVRKADLEVKRQALEKELNSLKMSGQVSNVDSHGVGHYGTTETQYNAVINDLAAVEAELKMYGNAKKYQDRQKGNALYEQYFGGGKVLEPEMVRKSETGKAKYEADRKAAEEKGAETLDYGWNIIRKTRGVWRTEKDRLEEASWDPTFDDASNLNSEDRMLFYALYADDPEKAMFWARYANDIRNEEYEKWLAEWAGESGVNAGAAFFQALGNRIGSGAVNLVDPHSATANQLARTASGLLAGGGQLLNEWSGTFDTDIPIVKDFINGKGLGDFYQLANSIVESGINAYVSKKLGAFIPGGGESGIAALGVMLMGSSASAADYNECIKRGLTPGQAQKHALAAGINEALFEFVSLDKLLDEEKLMLASTVSEKIKGVFAQAGVEASEEFCTTVANRLADAAQARRDGYDTQIEQRAKELIALGLSRDEAMEKAEKEWMVELINDAIGGFISGGGLKLGAYAVSAPARAAVNAVQNVRTTNKANEIRGSFTSAEEAQALKSFAEANGIKVSERVAQSTEENETENAPTTEQEAKLSRREIRQERKANRETGALQTAVVSKLAETVHERGLNSAQAIFDEQTEQHGAAITRVVQTAVTREAQAVFAQAKSQSELNQLYQKAIENATAKPVKQALKQAYQDATTLRAYQGDKEAMTDALIGGGSGRTLDLSAEIAAPDGSTQNVQIKALNTKQGEVVLDNGSTVALDELQGLDADTKDVIQRLDAFELGEARPLAFLAYQTAVEKGEVTDGTRWVMSWALAFDQGRNGAISMQEAVKRSSLPADVVRKAYELGAKQTETWRRQKEAENAEKRKKAKDGATGRKGILDTSALTKEQYDSLSADKKDALRTLELIAEATGVDIRLIAQKVTKRGNVKGYQGLYNKDGNYIEIDINAGINNIFEDLNTGMTAVLGHELTHWMQENAPTEYLAYKKAVLQAIMSTKNGELTLDRMIEAQIKQNKRAGKEITRSQAEDEVVADASMKRMGDTEFWNAVADNLGEKKADVFAKIKEYISKFFNRVREIIGKASHTSEAAKIIDKAEADVQATLRRLYAEGIGAAMRNSAQTGSETKNAATEGGELFSSRQVEQEYKNPDNLSKKDVLSMLKSADYGMLDDGQYIPIRQKSPAMLHAAIKEANKILNLPQDTIDSYLKSRAMIMQVYKARQAQAPESEQFGNSHGHGLTAKQIINIIQKMAKPVHVGYQGKSGRFFEIVHYNADGGKGDVAVFYDLNRYKDPTQTQRYKSEDQKYDIAVTLVPLSKNDIKKMVSNSKNIVFTPDYTKGVPQLTSGNNVPSVLNDTPFYEQSIAQDEGPVKYSLRPVEDVNPSSSAWERGATFDEVKAKHPTLFALDADESDTRNPTQVKVTVSTYKKIYEKLKAEGFKGTILDASSGLGLGTQVGRDDYGFKVEDIEPFPDKSYKPMYTDYSTLDKTYDAIISNAVLNVIPQDLRDAMVVKIGEMLNPGGRAFINVRGDDVLNAGSKVPINEKGMEYFISNTGSYQKGFTKSELKAYLEDALGSDFDVKIDNSFGKVSAVVTKKADKQLSTRSTTDSTGRELSEGQQAYFKDSVIRDKSGKLLPVYHGTKADFTVFDFSQGGAHGTQEGYGIYLTTDKRVSDSYGDRIIEGYANIKRPATSWQKTIKRGELAKLIKTTCQQEAQRMVNDGEYGTVQEALFDTWISNYIMTYENPNMEANYRAAADVILQANGDDMNIVQEVMIGMGIRGYQAAMEFYHNALTPVTGIDGFWTKWKAKGQGVDADVILAFDSNQVKNVDNLNPTENPDIRYATRDYSDVSDLDLLLNAAEEISEGGGEEYWASLLENEPGLAGEAEEIKRLGKQLKKTETELAEAQRNLTLTDRKLKTRGIATLAATIMQDQKAGDINKKDVKNRIAAVLTEAYQKALDQLDAGADIGTAWETVYSEGVVKAADILLSDATYAEKLGYKWYKNTLGAYLGEGAREYVEADIGARVAEDFNLNRYRPGQKGTVADRLVAQAENRVNKKLDAAKTENAALKAENAKLSEDKAFFKEQAETAAKTAKDLYDQLVDKREELKNNTKISAEERKKTLKKLDNLQKQMQAKRKEAQTWKEKAQGEAKKVNQAIREKEAAVAKLEKQLQRERDILEGKLKPPAIQKMLAAAREREGKRIAEMKDERFAKYKEKQSAAQLRSRIKNLSDEMKRKMTKPTDGSYVPASLYGAMTRVADLLDNALAPKAGTKAEAKYRAMMDAIHALQSEYGKVAEMDDYTYKSEFDAEIMDEIKELEEVLTKDQSWVMAASNDNRALREYSLGDLTRIYEILRTINESMTSASHFLGKANFQSNWDAMGQIVEQQQSMKPLTEVSKHEQNKRERLLNKLNVMRAVEMMSGYDREAALYLIMQAVENGTVDVESWVMQYNKAFESLKTGKNELEYRNALTKLLDYGVQDERGNAVKMTKMQAIQLLMIAEREAHNKDLIHLSRGGAVIRDAKAMRNGKEGVAHTIRVTPELIQRIQDSMTAWDKAYMQTMRNYLAKEGKATNRVLYKLKHRVLQTEDYYMPYSVDKDYLDTKIDESNYDNLGVQTPGSTQALKRKAPQPVIIDGADAFMAHHVREMAKYIGLAIPIRDFAKVYNGRLKQGENENPLPVKKTIGDNFGKEGQKLLVQALIDVQGGRSNNNHRTKIGQLLSTLQSMFYRKSLLINASVTIKQAASYAAAASIIDYDLLERANHPLWSAKDVDESKASGAGGLIRHLFLAPNGKTAQRIFNEIDAHTSSNYIRRQGMSMREIASEANKNGPVKQAIGMAGAKLEQMRGGHQVRTALESLDPISWIQRMDAATTATLWVACKLQAKRDGFSVGSAEYWNHTTELYERVLRETQPMYDSLHRNNYQKDKEGIVQYIFPFRTVPIQNHGQLVNAFENYKAAKESGDKARIAKASRFFRKTVVAQTASAAIFAAMTFLANAAKRKTKKYRDEDEELTLESLALGLGEDTIGTLISVFAPLAGSALWDTATNAIDAAKTGKNVRSYDAFSVGVVDLLNNAWNSTEGLVKDFAQMVGGKDVSKDTFLNDLQKFVSAGLEAAGFPASTVKTYTQGIIGNVNDVLEGRIPALNDASWERSNATNARRFIKALEAGDEAKAEAVMEEMRQNILKDKPNLKADKVNAKIQSAVQSYVKQQYLDDEMSEDKAIHYMVEYGSADDENDAFWKIREWEAREAWDGEADDFSFSKYTKLREIIDNVGDISEEMQYLQDHGVKFEDANKEIKSYIGKQLKAGEYDEDEAMETLQAYHKVKDERTKQYRPDTEDEAWFSVQEWMAQAEHADEEDYSWNKYEDLFAAMDAGGDIEPHADELESHGVKTNTIKDAVVAHVKERYEAGEVNASEAMRLLQKYSGMDANEAYWKVDEWDAKEAAYNSGEEFSSTNYRDLYAAMDANKDASAAIKELTDHGYKKSQITEATKNYLKSQLEEGKINETQFRNKIAHYLGITKTEDGDVLVKEVSNAKRYKEMQKQYPNLDFTSDEATRYCDGTTKSQESGRKSAKAAGMSLEAYLKARAVLKDVKGYDNNGDGKADNYSREKMFIQALDSMNLTSAQKWALYYEEYEGKNWNKVAKPSW